MDAIVLVALRCLVGGVVVTASGGMPMGADVAAKQASYDKQAAYIALAPLGKIAGMKPSN